MRKLSLKDRLTLSCSHDKSDTDTPTNEGHAHSGTSPKPNIKRKFGFCQHSISVEGCSAHSVKKSQSKSVCGTPPFFGHTSFLSPQPIARRVKKKSDTDWSLLHPDWQPYPLPHPLLQRVKDENNYNICSPALSPQSLHNSSYVCSIAKSRSLNDDDSMRRKRSGCSLQRESYRPRSDDWGRKVSK